VGGGRAGAAGPDLDEAREEAALLRLERGRLSAPALEDDLDPAAGRRPHPEVRAVPAGLRAHGRGALRLAHRRSRRSETGGVQEAYPAAARTRPAFQPAPAALCKTRL